MKFTFPIFVTGLLLTYAAQAQVTPPIPLSDLATQPADSVVANCTSSSASPQACSSGAINVTKTGGVTQSSAAWISALDPKNNVLNIQAQSPLTIDYTTTINTLLAQKKIAYLPNTGAPYYVNGQLTFYANSALYCDPGTTIVSTGTSFTFVVLMSASDVVIRNCMFEGTNPYSVFGSVSGQRFHWFGGGVSGLGRLEFDGATDCDVDRVTFTGGLSYGILLNQSTTNCRITNNSIQMGADLGIYAIGGANQNLIEGNHTDGSAVTTGNFNARELIGIRWDSHDNVVANNTAIGTGDNGISITGSRNKVYGNKTYQNKLTGLFIYGGENVVADNVSIGNGQAHNSANVNLRNAGDTNPYAGVEISGAFGGTGQNNNVHNNYADDDQPTMTQAYGVWIGPGYGNWASGHTYSANNYVYASGNIYIATTVYGASGTMTPSGTSTWNDVSGTSTGTSGTTWTYVASMDIASREPQGNTVGPNTVNRSLTAPFFDQTVNQANLVVLEGQRQAYSRTGTEAPSTIVGGWRSNYEVWSPVMTVTNGETVYVPTSSNAYRVQACPASCVTGPMGSYPTHTSGSATTSPDNITWLYLGTGARAPANPDLTINRSYVQLGKPLCVQVTDTTATTGCPTITGGAGTPLSKVVAPVGSLYLRSDGGSGTTLYVKESGTDNTGWVAK